MSGKYSKKTAKSKKRRGFPWLICGVILALVIGALIFIAYRESRKQPESTQPTLPQETQSQSQPQQEQPTDASTETGETQAVEGLDLGSGVIITGYLPYTGAFMEDRTDEVVSDVLGIQVTNTGEEYIQTMDITLTAGDITAEFSLSTLFPGQSVVVLEKNRMAYSDAPEFTEAQTSSVALFDGHPGMSEEKLQIQCLNGVINITNISGEDITNDIFVYYKNYISGIYYGGITYRLRIEGGLKAGEIRQGSAAHFNPSNSAVVFVTCG